jgi:hypothetical protein
VSAYRSKEVDRDIVANSNMIIPLVSIIKEDFVCDYPEAAGKVFLPSEVLERGFSFHWEDPSLYPRGKRFYNLVHNDPTYIDKSIHEIEDFLKQSLPVIVVRLFGKGGKEA